MAFDSLSLSQPLYGGGYNEYLLNKMQNKGNPQSALQPALQQAQQGFSQESLMNTVSEFSSELHSQNLVRAMATVRQQEAQSAQTGLAPTLAEKGANIDKNGNIHMSSGHISSGSTQSNSRAVPEESMGMPLNYTQPIALNKKTTMALRGLHAMSLDNRSLGILSRIAKREQNPEPIKKHTTEQAQNKTNTVPETSSVGNLAEKFESAAKGSQAIGYDRNGGTSYGTYQLSSKAGTFDKFLTFLEKEEPEWAKTLKNAGNANTGSRSGAVPTAWQELCAQNPERMKELEHSFIVQSHYKPVLNYVQKKWDDTISPALKEVIFSTAVQHGVTGAKRVIDQALSRMSTQNTVSPETEQKNNELLMAGFEEKTEATKNEETTIHSKQHQAEFIKNIYANRKNKFGSSTVAVQQSARNRFVREQNDALAMLG